MNDYIHRRMSQVSLQAIHNRKMSNYSKMDFKKQNAEMIMTENTQMYVF